MATALPDSCTICTATYDLGRRQSVALPCGHNFCLSCLVRLKANGKCQCPTCRRNWAGFEVSALPGMEALRVALQQVMEEAKGENPPSKAAFVDPVQKYGTKHPSPETVRAAEQLEGGELWRVDNANSEAALLALADRQPRILRLLERDDAREALSVAALSSAAKGCEVWAMFYDTFYSATNTATDGKKLQHLTANKRCRLD